MAINSNHRNSVSSVGSGLRHETVPNQSNLGLNHLRDGDLFESNLGLGQQNGIISHQVTKMVKSFVSSDGVRFHTTYNSNSFIQTPPSFSLIREITTFTEVVKTTRFLTPTSTLDRIFGSSSRPITQTQPPALINQTSQIQQPHNIFNHNNHFNSKRETIFYPGQTVNQESGNGFDYPTAVIWQNPGNQNWSNYYNINQLRDPSFGHTRAFGEGSNNHAGNQPRLQISSKDIYDENGSNSNALGYDGITHSLPNYPKGTYGCPMCFGTFYRPHTFASHIKSHYKEESKEKRKIRLAAKCRKLRRKLHLLQSKNGLTIASESSNSDSAFKIESVNQEVRRGLGLMNIPITAGAAKKVLGSHSD